MATRQSTEDFSAARVSAALAALDELRGQLDAASHSQLASSELANSLRDFWRDQGPLLKQLAATVLESLRVQALEEAYKAREQLRVDKPPQQGP